jgi:maltose-binding protein MalE
MATYWNIGKERNRKIFQSKETPAQQLKEQIQKEISWRDNGLTTIEEKGMN